MTWSEFLDAFWWILPLVMMALCFFGMGRARGAMMCGFGSGDKGSRQIGDSNSALEILDKRYARGEINDEEYEEKKRTLAPTR